MFIRLLKVAAATLLYAGIHTLLASRPAKKVATRLLGERLRNALYRPFYNAQSVTGLVLLGVYVARQPARELYQAQGFTRVALRVGQAGSVCILLVSITQIGWGRFTGLSNLIALLRGETYIAREPESQAAILGADGKMKAVGTFRVSRNAVNFIFLPLLWLNPRQTDRAVLFNSIITVYLVLGSYHSEARMRARYGKAMEEYQKSGVPFFIPSLKPFLESSSSTA